MAQPGTLSRIVLASLWLLVGAGMLAVPVWLGWTRWRVFLNGHPSMLAAAIFCGSAGVVALAWSLATLLIGGRYDREGDPSHPRHRTPRQLRQRAKWRIGLAVPALAICVALAAALAWARPFTAAPVAVAAMRSGGNIQISDRLTWYEMKLVRKNKFGDEIKPTVGLVFSPGARVDARAYAHILRPVAAAGYLVVVLKEPFGVALADPNHAGTVLKVHPEVTRWAVGGHSVGGVAAAAFADTHGPKVRGLLLYAAYPATKLTRRDLKVVSISGDADGLATPADIAESKSKLPPTTRFVVVKGGLHASFGDYGAQPGDGMSAVSRKVVQGQIIKSTAAFMASMKAPRKKLPVKKAPPKKK